MRSCFILLAFLASFLVVGCGVAHPQCRKVDADHGVYASVVYSDGVIAFRHSNDLDYPLDVFLYRLGKSCEGVRFDKYSFEGGPPMVEHVFGHEYRGKLLLFVIVSWRINNRGAGVYGKLYQVYAYEKDGKGGFAVDEGIVQRNDMTGIEGTDQGMPSHFYGKTPSEVIKLLGSRR